MLSQHAFWTRAAEALGIRVEAPARITVDGRPVEFTALLPDFGGPNGMVAHPDWTDLEPFVEALTAAGFGFSCVTIEEAGDLREMLRDWGWSASSPQPHWF